MAIRTAMRLFVFLLHVFDQSQCKGYQTQHEFCSSSCNALLLRCLWLCCVWPLVILGFCPIMMHYFHRCRHTQAHANTRSLEALFQGLCSFHPVFCSSTQVFIAEFSLIKKKGEKSVHPWVSDWSILYIMWLLCLGLPICVCWEDGAVEVGSRKSLVWLLLIQMYLEGNVKYDIIIGCISKSLKGKKRTKSGRFTLLKVF